jgi:hypothetical protein
MTCKPWRRPGKMASCQPRTRVSGLYFPARCGGQTLSLKKLQGSPSFKSYIMLVNAMLG